MKSLRTISRPMNMLSAIDRAGDMASVWYTVSIPALRASIGEWKLTGLPSNSTVPSSGITAPETALISVDLPAPLSPITARISPG
ncbi:hypothetical protein MAA5396_05129 [Marinovum algicola]|nr:hypothetical protein MAA5396_05129 [Marinovum algicola]